MPAALPAAVPHRPDLRTAYDAQPVLEPLEAAGRHPASGMRTPLAARVQGLLDSLEARHGAFGDTLERAERWREAWRVGLTRALAAVPLLLVRPHPEFRYVLFGPEQAIGLHNRGFLVATGYNNSENGRIPQEDLVHDEGSALYWDRAMRCAPVVDLCASDPARAPAMVATMERLADMAGSRFQTTNPKPFLYPVEQLFRPPLRQVDRRGCAIPYELFALAGHDIGAYNEWRRRCREEAERRAAAASDARDAADGLDQGPFARMRAIAHPTKADFRQAAADLAGGEDVPVIAPACWAAGRLMMRTLWQSAMRAAKCAQRRLLDDGVVRDARRLGERDLYAWLAAVDQPIDRGPTVALRRRQFARAYPEFAGAVCFAAIRGAPNPNHTSKADLATSSALLDIAAAVDAAEPLGPRVKAMREWPGWVERALRSRFTACRGNGLYLERRFHDKSAINLTLLNQIARTLGALGPAWRPRRGDDQAMARLSALCSQLNMDPRNAIGAACTNPGNGASPWKRVWQRMPEGLRAGLVEEQRRGVQRPIGEWLGTTVSDLGDMLLAFNREIVNALIPPEGRDDLNACNRALDAAMATGALNGADGPAYRHLRAVRGRHVGPHPLHGMSLPVLLNLTQEWHERLTEIVRAKAGRVVANNGTPRGEWPALFAPFCMIAGRVEVACITNQAALQDHGSTMSHCVGGYARDCMTRHAHIVAFTVDEKYVATAHFDLVPPAHMERGGEQDGVPAMALLRQARGRRNGALPAEAAAALDALKAVLHGAAPPEEGAPLPALYGLHLADPQYLERERSDRAEGLGDMEAVSTAGYDVDDVEAAERVLVAWRFAMPDKMRAAWEKGGTPSERVGNVRAWLRAWAARERRTVEEMNVKAARSALAVQKPPAALAA